MHNESGRQEVMKVMNKRPNLEALLGSSKDVFTPKEQLFFHLWERDYRRVYWKDNRLVPWQTILVLSRGVRLAKFMVVFRTDTCCISSFALQSVQVVVKQLHHLAGNSLPHFLRRGAAGKLVLYQTE